MRYTKKACTVILLIGFLAGLTNGLLGAAGGIVIVMGLRALTGGCVTNGRSFYTTALAVMLPLSVLTAYQYARAGHLPAPTPEGIVFPAVLGGALGAWLLPFIKQGLLHRVFAVLILVSGIMLAV